MGQKIRKVERRNGEVNGGSVGGVVLFPFFGKPASEEVMDDFLKILIGCDEVIIRVDIMAFIFNPFHKFPHRLTVFIRYEGRFGDDGCFVFHIHKSMRPFEVEVDLLFVE